MTTVRRSPISLLLLTPAPLRDGTRVAVLSYNLPGTPVTASLASTDQRVTPITRVAASTKRAVMASGVSVVAVGIAVLIKRSRLALKRVLPGGEACAPRRPAIGRHGLRRAIRQRRSPSSQPALQRIVELLPGPLRRKAPRSPPLSSGPPALVAL